MITIKSKTRTNAVMVWRQGKEIVVGFGTMSSGEFMCAHYRENRYYKTEAGARRAVNNWIVRGR